MSIELKNLDTLTPEAVAQKQTLLAQLLQEALPELDVSKGALHDIVLYLHAILSAKTSAELDRYKSAQSLLAVTQDPTLADESVVDKILSNYNVSRKGSMFTAGTVTLQFERDLAILIPSDTRFTFGTDTYRVNEAVVVCSTTSNQTPRLTPAKDGTFLYNVSVTAETAGILTPVTAGDTLLTDLGTVTAAWAAEDFTPGRDEESNTAMISRLAEGMATPCWGNRFQIAALLRQKIDTLTGLSVIGFGDEEMTRDQLTIFPVSVGGKADLYVKTALEYQTVPLPAMFTGIRNGLEQWEVTVPAEVCPGCYRAVQASLENRTWPISEQTVIGGIGFTAGQILHLRFQTEDEALTGNVGDTKTFDITFAGQKDVHTAQEIFDDRALMPVSEDALVRSAYPCWVSVTLQLSKDAGNEEELQHAAANYIDSTGFTGYILTSELIRVLHPLLADGQQIDSIHLTSETWGPAGQNYRDAASQKLSVPYVPEQGITSRTTVFYTRNVTVKYNTKS